MLNFGIIGAGNIAHLHAQALEGISGARLVAVADPIPQQAQFFAEKWQVDAYSDFRDMLQRPHLDVVCICTPSGWHASQGIAAAEAGKHVVVEKPIALTPADADALIEACRRQGVLLSPICQRRFEGPIRRLREALQQGRLGRPVLGDAQVKWYRSPEYYAGTWRGTWAMDGGGALMNQSIHAIDLLHWLMGPVESVFGYTATLVHRIETEDVASAALRFRSGALGHIEGTTAAWPGLFMRLEVHGDQGSAVLQDSEIVYFQTADGQPLGAEDADTPRVGSGAADPLSISSAGHRAQLQDVVEAIHQGRPPFVTGEDGRETVALLWAIYESARTGQEVRL